MFIYHIYRYIFFIYTGLFFLSLSLYIYVCIKRSGSFCLLFSWWPFHLAAWVSIRLFCWSLLGLALFHFQVGFPEHIYIYININTHINITNTLSPVSLCLIVLVGRCALVPCGWQQYSAARWEMAPLGLLRLSGRPGHALQPSGVAEGNQST